MELGGLPDEDSRYSLIEGYSVSLYDILMDSGVQ